VETIGHGSQLHQVEVGVAHLHRIERPPGHRHAGVQRRGPLRQLQRIADAPRHPLRQDREHVRVQVEPVVARAEEPERVPHQPVAGERAQWDVPADLQGAHDLARQQITLSPRSVHDGEERVDVFHGGQLTEADTGSRCGGGGELPGVPHGSGV
jgi:hypothetical protein